MRFGSARPEREKKPVLSFGLFADAHYAEKQYADRFCWDSLEKLRACIGTFNERGLAMALSLGDFVDSVGDREAEIGCIAAMRAVYSSLRGERHFVLGNHDLETFTKEEFLGSCGAERHTPYYSFDRLGVHFVVLDGNCHADGTDFAAGDFDWANAWVSEAQVAWLREDLRAARERKTIVFCHGNLDHRLEDGELDPHIVRNAAEVRGVLEGAGNVIAVIQGHYHPGMYTNLDGIPYLTLAAMVVGPGLESNAYAIVSLYEEGTLVVEGFGRQKSHRIAPAIPGAE